MTVAILKYATSTALDNVVVEVLVKSLVRNQEGDAEMMNVWYSSKALGRR